MSRIGNRLIAIPEGVQVAVSGNNVEVKGPKGTLTKTFSDLVLVKVEDNKVKVERLDEKKQTKQLHGTTNSLILGMIEGVSKGFERQLQINGVGYRAALSGNTLNMQLGYSHPIAYTPIEGVKIEVPSQIEIKVSGIDKQKVMQVAAEIRAFKKPEPYKGKGIKYKDEQIRRKEGKTAGKK